MDAEKKSKEGVPSECVRDDKGIPDEFADWISVSEILTQSRKSRKKIPKQKESAK
jgi:hypothetical protein